MQNKTSGTCSATACLCEDFICKGRNFLDLKASLPAHPGIWSPRPSPLCCLMMTKPRILFVWSLSVKMAFAWSGLPDSDLCALVAPCTFIPGDHCRTAQWNKLKIFQTETVSGPGQDGLVQWVGAIKSDGARLARSPGPQAGVPWRPLTRNLAAGSESVLHLCYRCANQANHSQSSVPFHHTIT